MQEAYSSVCKITIFNNADSSFASITEFFLLLIKKYSNVIHFDVECFFYFSSAEAKNLFDCATELGLTSKEYMWIISSSSIGNIVSKARRAAPSYPLGLLGMSFVEIINIDLR